MNFLHSYDEAVCRKVQTMLSDYIDNALSARQVLEVERHLSCCAECIALSRQMQTTVELLRNIDRYDTSGDFMAKLHARLDNLEPEPSRRLLGGIQDWLLGARASFQSRRLPAFSLGMGMVALAAGIFFARPVVTPPALTPPPVSGSALQCHVALTAGNPFDDPAAANLEAAVAAKDSNQTAGTE